MRCRLSPAADVPSHTSGAAVGHEATWASAAQLPMCEHKSTENASSQSRPCAKISTMSDNRSSVVNLSRRIALAPRTRRRSRPHGAHRGGLGQVNSAGRDVAEYSLERKRTSSTSSAGLPKRRAVDTYPRYGWARPGHACLWTDILNPL